MDLKITKNLRKELIKLKVLNQIILNTFDYDPKYTYKFIESLFEWRCSPEGYKYWDKISDKIVYMK